MLACVATICSCQKHDSTAEAQLAQRKSDLDARETALGEREKMLVARERALAEREKTLDAREKALAERDKATANASTIRTEPQRRQVPDAAQAKAERDRRIEQLPPEFRALIPDASQVEAKSRRNNKGASDPAEAKAESDRTNLSNQRQVSPEDLQREYQRKLDEARASAAAMAPEAEDTLLTPSPTPQ